MAEKADGSVVISFDADVSKADKELAKLKKKIAETEAEIEKTQKARDEAHQQGIISAAELDVEKAKLQEMKQQLIEIRQIAKDKTYSPDMRAEAAVNADGLRTEIAEQQERVRLLQSDYNKIENSVDRYDQKLRAANETLEQHKETAGQLVQETNAANSAFAKMGEAVSAVNGYMGKFTSRIAKLAKNIFVFTLISSALRSLKSWLGKAIKSNDEARASIAKLKGALLTLAQPLVDVIIPAFTKFVNILASLVTSIAQFVSKIFGTTASDAAKSAEELYDEQKALDGVGSSAKKASKKLAAFDEINTLSTSDDSSGSKSSTIEPDFSAFSSLSDAIGDEMDRIATLVGGALLALGAILAFSGVNIPLGISLMALGALTLASVISENWEAISTALQGPLGVIMGILSGALFVLGAVLAFSGVNIPVGLALMAMGAAGLATVVSLNWEKISSALQGPIGVITAILSGALLALGAVLAFSGVNIPLGIGLMALGAAGLATTVAANWEKISTMLQGPIGVIVALVSGALLVLGAVLAFSGVSIPLGLGLLALGAAGLAADAVANWDTVSTLLQGPIGAITAAVSSALLVLGAVLAFSGVALPLGLGLMIVGAAGLAATVVANWNYITEALGGPLGAIIAIVSSALLVLGVILLFTGVATPIGLGLLIAGATGLAAAIAPNWDFIVEKIKGVWESVKRFWNTYIAPVFTKDFWKDLAKKCGNGLLDGFEAGINGIITMFEKMINWVVDGLNKISFTIPDWVPALGGKKFGFNLKNVSFGRVSIPRLAEGAVIPPNREFLAVLGDQRSGTNIETPLSTMVEAFKRAMAESGSGGTYTFVVNLDGREVARNTIRHMNDMTRERGKSVVLV